MANLPLQYAHKTTPKKKNTKLLKFSSRTSTSQQQPYHACLLREAESFVLKMKMMMPLILLVLVAVQADEEDAPSASLPSSPFSFKLPNRLLITLPRREVLLSIPYKLLPIIVKKIPTLRKKSPKPKRPADPKPPRRHPNQRKHRPRRKPRDPPTTKAAAILRS